MVVIADSQWVAAQEVQKFGKHLCGAIGDGGGLDWRRTEEASGMQAREDAVGGAEEDGKAEGEEVRCVAKAGEDVAWDLEVFTADLDDGFGVKELGDEAGYWAYSSDPKSVGAEGELTAVELSICE